MSKEQEDLYFTEQMDLSLAEDGSIEGKFEGVAYSGKAIARHGYLRNLIMEVDSMTFKPVIPVYRNHDDNRIAGNAKLFKDGSVLKVKEGKLFESSPHAQEIKDLAQDGMKWEFSIGIRGDYRMEFLDEGLSTTVNGKTIKGPANIIRDAKVKEVSFVPVGADASTSTRVFKEQGEKEMNLEEKVKELEAKNAELSKELEGKMDFSQEDLDEIALACSCQAGASKKEIKQSAASMKEENEKLKKKLAELMGKLKKFEKDDKKKKLSEAAEGKVELSEEKIEALLEDEVKLAAYMEFLGDLPKGEKKIDKKFAEKKDIEPTGTDEHFSAETKAAARRKLAKEMVEKGEAKNFADAIAMLPEENFEV